VLDIEPRLANWARCMRTHPVRLRCLSLEGRYRSPQRNMWEVPVPALHGSMDLLDAWRIECGVNTLAYPDRLILRLHYCVRARSQTVRSTLRKNGRHDFRDFHFELLRCHMALIAALELTQDQTSNKTRTWARLCLRTSTESV